MTAYQRKEKYHSFVDQCEEIPLFFQSWWLDSVSGEQGWDCAIAEQKDGSITAVWPFVFFKRYGMTMLLQPLLTPGTGIYFKYPADMVKIESKYSYEKKITNMLVAQLPKVSYINQLFHPGYNNWQPLHWNGFTQTLRYTYVLADLNDPDRLRANYKSSVRNDIAKAKSKYNVVKEIDGELLYELNEKTFRRKGGFCPFSEEYFLGIVNTCSDHDCIDMFFVRDEAGQNVAGTMIVYDKMKAYCLSIGLDKTLKPEGAVQLLLDHAIVEASKRVNVFDFEGSMIEEVEKVFRSFGGEQTPYFVLRRAKNKLISMAYHLVKGE